jgi:hypothetical protein
MAIAASVRPAIRSPLRSRACHPLSARKGNHERQFTGLAAFAWGIWSIAGFCLGGGEKRDGHIVAICGILLKLPPKMTLEKCREYWSFALASYISGQ